MRATQRLISLHSGNHQGHVITHLVTSFMELCEVTSLHEQLVEEKREIQEEIGEIDRGVCVRVIVNFNNQMTVCRERGGEHMLDIIFNH